MTVAFALAGGGALAATQVGMLRALLAAGIRPDLLVGSSAGAINAFCFGEHPTERGLDRLQRLWGRMRRRDVFPLDVGNIVAGLVGRRDGLVSPDRLGAFLRRQVGTADLGDTQVPVHIVATDLAAGEPVVLSDGRVLDALMATTAMPGVFPPFRIGERRFVDGGITADTPIRQAEDLGATVTYILPTVGPSNENAVPRGAVPVLLHAISHLFGHVVTTDMAGARGEVHLLPAPVHEGANPFDFRSTERLIDLGYEAASAALADRAPMATSLRRCG